MCEPGDGACPEGFECGEWISPSVTRCYPDIDCTEGGDEGAAGMRCFYQCNAQVIAREVGPLGGRAGEPAGSTTWVLLALPFDSLDEMTWTEHRPRQPLPAAASAS